MEPGRHFRSVALDPGYIRTRAGGEGLSIVTKAENVTLTGMVFDGNDAVPDYRRRDDNLTFASCAGPAFDAAVPPAGPCVVDLVGRDDGMPDGPTPGSALGANQYTALLAITVVPPTSPCLVREDAKARWGIPLHGRV